MAFDQNLAEHIRILLNQNTLVSEKRMFGGIGFLLNGNLVCGVHGENLIARIGSDIYGTALEKPFTKPFDMTGRPMSGWVEVTPEGVAADSDLQYWVQMSLSYVGTLPPK
jgi:hypothetical protein